MRKDHMKDLELSTQINEGFGRDRNAYGQFKTPLVIIELNIFSSKLVKFFDCEERLFCEWKIKAGSKNE